MQAVVAAAVVLCSGLVFFVTFVGAHARPYGAGSLRLSAVEEATSAVSPSHFGSVVSHNGRAGGRASNSSSSVAVLIAGSQERLLLQSKAKYVVGHLARQGVRVDVFVELTAAGAEVGLHRAEANVSGIAATEQEAIANSLRREGARLVNVLLVSPANSSHEREDPANWSYGHAGMPCDGTVERLMGRAASTATYEYVLLDRDDSEWLGPLELQTLVRPESHAVYYNKECQSAIAIDNKTLLFTWAAAMAMLPDLRTLRASSREPTTERFWAAAANASNISWVPVEARLLPAVTSLFAKEPNGLGLCQEDICEGLRSFRPGQCDDPADVRSLLLTLLQRIPLLAEQTVMQYKRWSLQFAPSLVAIVLGLCMYNLSFLRTLAPFVLFFGAQTFMNLFMKGVLSGCAIKGSGGLQGVPAPFAVTAMQQCVGFVCTGTMSALSQLTPWPFKPRPLKSRGEWLTVGLYSLFFCFNIGLNNWSLSMLDISLNIIIRCGAPAAVAVLQFSLAMSSKSPLPKISRQEMLLFWLCSFCMALTALAKSLDDSQPLGSALVPIGVTICLGGLLASACELLTISGLGLNLGLNPVEILFYTAIPSTVLLSIPLLVLPHSTWHGSGVMTDLQVVVRVAKLSPQTLGLVVPSGLFALLYNVLLFQIVQGFSPAHAATASCVNKAATIAFALMLGVEVLPRTVWLAVLLVLGILGTLGSSLQLGLLRAAK